MITIDNDGRVVVEASGRQYCLSESGQYTDFLLWITSPDESVTIGDAEFVIDEDLEEEDRAKAERYSGFLSGFAQKRREMLKAASGTITFAQREADIKAFIERLGEE